MLENYWDDKLQHSGRASGPALPATLYYGSLPNAGPDYRVRASAYLARTLMYVKRPSLNETLKTCAFPQDRTEHE